MEGGNHYLPYALGRNALSKGGDMRGIEYAVHSPDVKWFNACVPVESLLLQPVARVVIELEQIDGVLPSHAM